MFRGHCNATGPSSLREAKSVRSFECPACKFEVRALLCFVNACARVYPFDPGLAWRTLGAGMGLRCEAARRRRNVAVFRLVYLTCDRLWARGDHAP